MRKITFCFIAFLLIVSPLSAEDTIEEETALRKQISLNKSDYAAITKLGILYQDKGDRGKALSFFKKAVKVKPDYPLAHFYLGRLYYLMQKPDLALSEFNAYKERARIRHNSDGDTKEAYIKNLHYISEVYFTLKRYENTKTVIDEVLELDPKNQTALYNLAVYYYVYEHNRSKAYELFKQVIELKADSYLTKRARYNIEYMRTNPDSRIAPDFSFIDQEYRE